MKSEIKLVATDCDGVLTDGGLYYSASGEEFKRFCVLDGVGFQTLAKMGVKTAVITAEENEIIKARVTKLEINYLIMGKKDKLAALIKLCDDEGINLNNTVYIGDDINDIGAIKSCGFGCAPSDALQQVRSAAKYVTLKKGGNGCFREVVDYLIKKNMLVV